MPWFTYVGFGILGVAGGLAYYLVVLRKTRS
jgi:hypothetical protein